MNFDIDLSSVNKIRNEYEHRLLDVLDAYMALSVAQYMEEKMRNTIEWEDIKDGYEEPKNVELIWKDLMDFITQLKSDPKEFRTYCRLAIRNVASCIGKEGYGEKLIPSLTLINQILDVLILMERNEQAKKIGE